MNFDISAIFDALLFISKAIPRTLGFAAITLLCGIALGGLIAWGRLQGNRLYNAVCAIIVSFVRAVPLIVQIFLLYYSLPNILAGIYNAVTGAQIKPYDISPYIVAFVLFVIYNSIVQSENIRGALMSVPKGQYEAAVSVGLTRWQAYRRIIIPQALTVALPTFFTSYLHVVKMMALTFTIQVVDIFASADIFAALYSRRTEPYIADAIIYWVVCTVLTFVFAKWEKELRKYMPASNK